MTHYVFDTRFFVLCRDYYPAAFPSLWTELGRLVQAEAVSSVDEVASELRNYGGEQEHLMRWVSANHAIFTEPNEEEQYRIQEIFAVPSFTALIKEKGKLKSGPAADPFVIAKAMAMDDGVVVTGERRTPANDKGKLQGAPRIPNVCAHFNVRCISPEAFMAEREWRF